jgi:surface antigen
MQEFIMTRFSFIRRSISRTTAVAVTAAFVLAGQPTPGFADPPAWAPAHGWRAKQGYSVARFPDIGAGYCDRGLLGSQLVGIAAGGALGGFLGSKIGKGSGQLAATAAGALIGAFIGSEVAHSMDSRDQACVSRSLEGAPDNQTVTWRNPDTNADYRVTPVKSYDDTAGRYCREYITEAMIGGKLEQVYGTACYQPDGSWELVS